MDYLVTISEENGKLILDPQIVGNGDNGPVRVGDSITWQSDLDVTCQIGSFYPGHGIVPGTLPLGPGKYARILVMATPPGDKSVTYWCAPTAPQPTQGARQDTDSYDPGQGIIIVDPPFPDDDDHKEHKHKREKQGREAVIG